MKPFNLEEALKFAPLITRDGKYKNVKILNVDQKNKDYPLISNMGYEKYTLEGKFIIDSAKSDLDLFMQEDSDLENKFKDTSLILTCEKCISANQNLLYKIQRMEEEIKSLNKKIQQIKIIGENLISVCSKEYMP